jgi:DNA-binding NtrC family response regulator
MTGELMSSQLFGHVAGAFTGANYDALGSFRAANHGTLFLDEIGELEHALQAKLLRVLQERVVTPVGTHQGEPIDVRIVTATNRDLRSAVLDNRFREDLYFRLNVVHLKTTALCHRRSDILVLADEFLDQLAEEGFPRHSLSGEARGVLYDYDWPGNVRQLRNVLEQAVIDSPSPVIPARLLLQIISLSFACDDQADDGIVSMHGGEERDFAESTSPSARSHKHKKQDANWLSLQQVEAEHILHTLEHTFHNRSAAARLLGVTRQSLLRRMKRYGLDIPHKNDQ